MYYLGGMIMVMANYRGHIGGALVVCGGYVTAVAFLPMQWVDQTVTVLADWQMVAAQAEDPDP